MSKENSLKDVKQRVLALEKSAVPEPLCTARRETIDGRINAAIDGFKAEVKGVKQTIYITSAAIAIVIIIADFLIRLATRT